jgi:predicted Zn-dependent peptidase
MYRSLVRDKKIAAQAAGFNDFPGEKYPSLFVFFAVPAPGHTAAEMGTTIREEIEKLKTVDVSKDELDAVKTRAKADLIRQLDSDSGLAAQLATAQARHGDWRELFREIDRIDRVTPADIRRVAASTFVPNNRTVGMIESGAAASASGATAARGDSK